jgi:hypothetical protein
MPMLDHQRYPTSAEMELLMARARQLRSEYLGMLITRARLRARQFYSVAGERRITGAQHFYPDVG